MNGWYQPTVVLVISILGRRAIRDHAIILDPHRCLEDAAGLFPLLAQGARLSLSVEGVVWRYEAPPRRRKWKVAA